MKSGMMESGASSFTCRGRGCWLALAALLVVVSAAAAQQAASGTQPAQSGTAVGTTTPAAVPVAVPAALPAELPPAQPLSQAATSASGVAPDKAADAAQESADQPSEVKLGAGDLIEVNVYNVPELTSKSRVSLAGDVYLPLIDYVHVEGLTQEEAQSLIEKRLADGGFVRNPHVTIFVDEASSQGVTVLGEVAKPGIYQDVSDHKLYEVISQAGGFTASASRKIAVIRKSLPEPIRIDLPRNLADDLSGNVEILPGDTITVPRAPIIYIVGDVGRPSGLLVDNGTLTVLQAIALAGGTNHTAKLSGARILHKGPAGVTETKVEIKKMLEAKAPDVTLQADDILFIPVSGARVLAGRSFEAAMAAATAVGIYAVHP
jgi:polysaccharide export outer membrane protein